MSRLAFGVIAFALAAGACQWVSGIDDREVAPCNHAVPPDAAAGPDGPDLEPQTYALDLSFALRNDVGFDLDDTCSTSRGSTASCENPCGTTATDDIDGRDNTLGDFLSSVDLGAPRPQPGATANHRYRLLLRVSRYNGADEDPNVGVELYRSHGIAPLDGGAATPPTNDGNDVWTVVGSTFQVDGFVSKRKLYARIPRLDIDLGADQFLPSSPALPFALGLQNVVIGLPLPGAEVGTTGGAISGYWSVGALLNQLSTLQQPGTTDYLCGDAGAYPALRANVCHAADLHIGDVGDVADRSARCNGLSVAFDVSLTRAKLGPVDELPQSPIFGCGPDWTDTCDQPTSCGTTN